MVNQKFLLKHGVGPGTIYTVQAVSSIKKDLYFSLTNNDRKREFTFESRQSFIELKKIILTPLSRALVITLATVSYQAVRAPLSNPVNSLRTE